MVRIRIAALFANRGDPSLTLGLARRREAWERLIMQDKSAPSRHDGGAHLTLRLPIAYLLFRMAEAGNWRENRPKRQELGANDGSDHNASEH